MIIPELDKDTVRMKDPQRVEELIRALQTGGDTKLQVISDFDMTLSRFGFNGKRCPTCYNIVDNSNIISEDCRKKLKDLFNFYYPLEIDPHRTIEEKYPLMVEWWSKAHTLLCEQRIEKQKLAQIVKEAQAKLRWIHKDLGRRFQRTVPSSVRGLSLINHALPVCSRVMKIQLRGANVLAKTKLGNSPLHVASAMGKCDCVDELLANGAQTQDINENGHTALGLARLWHQKKAERHLFLFQWRERAATVSANTHLDPSELFAHQKFDSKLKTWRSGSYAKRYMANLVQYKEFQGSGFSAPKKHTAASTDLTTRI